MLQTWPLLSWLLGNFMGWQKKKRKKSVDLGILRKQKQSGITRANGAAYFTRGERSGTNKKKIKKKEEEEELTLM